MAQTGRRRACIGFLLILTFIIAGLHIAVGIYGVKWGDDRRDQIISYKNGANPLNVNVYDYTGSNSRLDPHHLYYSEMKQEAIYLWVTTACILILSILLIVVYCCKSYCIGPRGRHVLVTLILMLMFAAAVVLILRYVNNDNLNESIVPYSNYSTFDIQRNWRDQFNNFNTYYKLVFIDWILTFAWSVILFIFAYLQTLADVSQTDVLSPVVVDLPPLSARQF